MSLPPPTDPDWESGKVEELLRAALAYHDDCGHGQVGAAAECDAVCRPAVEIRERRRARAALIADAYRVPYWLVTDEPRPGWLVRAWYYLRGYRP